MTLELQTEVAPATPAVGYTRIYLDNISKRTKQLDDTGLNSTVLSTLGVTTTSVSSAVTAETKSLLGTIVGTFTIPANHSVVGKMFRIKARGVITTGATAGTITFFLKWAGITIASTGAVAPTISQSNMYWEMEADIIVRTIGATGTTFVQGLMHVQNAATPSAGIRWPVRGNNADPPAVVTIDTTANALIDLQSTTSNNLHTITCNMLILELAN